MRVLPTSVPGVLLVEPDVFRDARGSFLETFHQKRYREAGISCSFVQDNQSRSVRGTLRGMHAQLKKPQGKLVRVVHGEIFDVAVDIRPGSTTFGKWTAANLSGETFRQMFIPPGFAHGFCVLSESADVAYSCTEFYEGVIAVQETGSTENIRLRKVRIEEGCLLLPGTSFSHEHVNRTRARSVVVALAAIDSRGVAGLQRRADYDGVAGYAHG